MRSVSPNFGQPKNFTGQQYIVINASLTHIATTKQNRIATAEAVGDATRINIFTHKVEHQSRVTPQKRAVGDWIDARTGVGTIFKEDRVPNIDCVVKIDHIGGVDCQVKGDKAVALRRCGRRKGVGVDA